MDEKTDWVGEILDEYDRVSGFAEGSSRLRYQQNCEKRLEEPAKGLHKLLSRRVFFGRKKPKRPDKTG